MSATATKKKRKRTKGKSGANGSATITASQAKQLLAAEQAVKRQRAQLEEAEEELSALRDRLRPRIPLSSKKEERDKRIRSAVIGGIRVRVTPTRTGERFSLTTYREAGHEITPEMQDAISPGKAYHRWTVKPPS